MTTDVQKPQRKSLEIKKRKFETDFHQLITQTQEQQQQSNEETDDDEECLEKTEFKTLNQEERHDNLDQGQDQKDHTTIRRELHSVRNKLKLAKDQLRIHKEKIKCYICLNSMKLPLQVCKNFHYACAMCLHAQIKAKNGYKPRFYWNKENKMTCYVDVNTLICCGQCKSTCTPIYPGHFLSALVDDCSSSSSSNCPICKTTLLSSQVGLHVLRCKQTQVTCLFCAKELLADQFSKHVDTQCAQIPCKVLGCGITGDKFFIESHVGLHVSMKSLFAGTKKKLGIIGYNSEIILQNKIQTEQSMAFFKSLVNLDGILSDLINASILAEKEQKQSRQCQQQQQEEQQEEQQQEQQQ